MTLEALVVAKPGAFHRWIGRTAGLAISDCTNSTPVRFQQTRVWPPDGDVFTGVRRCRVLACGRGHLAFHIRNTMNQCLIMNACGSGTHHVFPCQQRPGCH
jgi:hypothetical protein